ncbi:hypothetical protein ALGA_1268 [Labilibaculum antarcticum]|uniref:DUF2975 domain-containing protein n=2 Tax=Labilibaculum antarcticum TaxID=1717717 RepID=A0A1Y1CHT9_9BACT|nr:hypothetical protein ALGA_1268 [Labilibaculum antarcticum]
MDLIFEWDGAVEMRFKLISSFVELPTSFTMLDGSKFDGVGEFYILPRVLEINNLFYWILSWLDQFVLFGVVVFITRQLKEVFGSISLASKSNLFFVRENYIRIKRVGLISIIFCIYVFIESTIYSYLFLKDLHVMDIAIHVNPDFSVLFGIFPALIILAIAQVYKAGIDMKEESELTI